MRSAMNRKGSYLTEVALGGTHGYVNSDPNMQAIFIASERVVPQGVHLDSIPNLDVAPNRRGPIGLDMKNVKGRAIQQIVDFNSRH